MDRKQKNLQRKIQVKLDQKIADIELRKEELEVAQQMKALSEKLDEDTSSHDQKIATIKERLEKLESDKEIIEAELQ